MSLTVGQTSTKWQRVEKAVNRLNSVGDYFSVAMKAVIKQPIEVLAETRPSREREYENSNHDVCYQ